MKKFATLTIGQAPALIWRRYLMPLRQPAQKWCTPDVSTD